MRWCPIGQRRVSEPVPVKLESRGAHRCFTDHVAAIYVGGLPQRWPRGPGAKSVNRRPPGRRVDPRLLQGRPQTIQDLQALAGNAAVSRLFQDRGSRLRDDLAVPALQRDPVALPNVPAGDDMETAIEEKFEILTRQIEGAEEDDPLEAARLERALLLLQFTDPATLLIGLPYSPSSKMRRQCGQEEDVTLAKLGNDAQQVMIQHPQAFPSSWADILAKTLDLGMRTRRQSPARRQRAGTVPRPGRRPGPSGGLRVRPASETRRDPRA